MYLGILMIETRFSALVVYTSKPADDSENIPRRKGADYQTACLVISKASACSDAPLKAKRLPSTTTPSYCTLSEHRWLNITLTLRRKHAGVGQRTRVQEPKSTQEPTVVLGGANLPTVEYVCHYAGCLEVLRTPANMRRHLWGHSGLKPDDPKAWPRFLEGGEKIYGCHTGRCRVAFEDPEKLL